MKKVYLTMAAILLVIGGIYAWEHRDEFPALSRLGPTHATESIFGTSAQSQLQWHQIDKSNMGFKLEMPGEPHQVVVEASTESGTNEPVSMLLVKPDADSSFAIAWAEKPPVARVNDLVPDKTLDQARDGAMSRTQSTPVSENRSTSQGYPARDFVSRNVGGGVLDTRLIYAGSRMYMLIATSPSTSARREEAITHFFNSFIVAGNAQIPETLPAATE
jgi:hypothetical protein